MTWLIDCRMPLHGRRPLRRRRPMSRSPMRVSWRSACQVVSWKRCPLHFASHARAGPPVVGRSRGQRAGVLDEHLEPSSHLHVSINGRAGDATRSPGPIAACWVSRIAWAHLDPSAGCPRLGEAARTLRMVRRIQPTGDRRCTVDGCSREWSSGEGWNLAKPQRRRVRMVTRTRTGRSSPVRPPTCCATAPTWCTASCIRTSLPSARKPREDALAMDDRCTPSHR